MQKKHVSTSENKNLKIKKKVAIVAIAVILSICTLSFGVVTAKYFAEKKSTGLVETKNFYFTSNLLDGKEYTLAPGTTSVTFTLSNHADDLRFSDVDIEYTVTVNNGATVIGGTGTIAMGSVNDVEVTISNLTAGKTYTITAVGTGGYKKTLTATIVVPEQNFELYYKIDDSAVDYILLTVWNEGEKEGTVTIGYTGTPDNTNDNMTEWQAGNNASQDVNIGAHESKVFRFFGGKVTVTGATKAEEN